MITMSKRFKKSMAMAMATAMALSIPAMPVYQNEKVEAKTQVIAEATSALDVKVSELAETAEVKVENGTADVLYYALTTQAKIDQNKYPSASAYEAVKYNKKGTKIDLSWVSRKKEQVLCVATGSSIEEIKPVTVTLKAQETLKATYSGALSTADIAKGNAAGDEDNGYLTFTTGKGESLKTVSTAAVQYRTVNGDWQYAVSADGKKSIDLSCYAAKGATLQMRKAPNDADATPAGKIINVKFKAKAKAPNVTVNYNDKEVSVPKDVQYSTDEGKHWSAATTQKGTVGFEKYGWDGSEKTVYFRTAATTGTKSKASSKIKYVTIKAEQSKFTELKAPVSGSAVASVDLDAFDVRYKTAYDSKSGLVFTNQTDKIYQVGLVKKTELKNATEKNGTKLIAASGSAIVSKNAKIDNKKKVTWATVKAATEKSGKLKAGTATIATKNVNLEDYAILYRICDTKGTTVNSEVRVFDVPSTVEHSIKVLDGTTEVTTLELAKTASGSAVTSKTLTVSGSGISDTATYTVAVYKDEACKQKDTELTATFNKTTKELTIKTITKTKAGKTYYVKVTVEGISTVVMVTVSE